MVDCRCVIDGYSEGWGDGHIEDEGTEDGGTEGIEYGDIEYREDGCIDDESIKDDIGLLVVNDVDGYEDGYRACRSFLERHS